MTQLEQINSLINDIYLVAGTLGTTAGKIKNLESEHYSASELADIHGAMLNAVNEVKRAAKPLNALRKDAELSNGITAAAGIEGLQKIAERFDRVMTDRYDRAMLKETNKANKAKTGADHES